MKVAVPSLAGVVTFLLALVSEAQAQKATSGLVSWAFDQEAVVGCLEPVALKADVESRLGRLVFVPEGSPESRATILLRTQVTRAGENYAARVELILPDGAVAGKRELSAPSCEELRALLPVVVSVLLEGEGLRVEPSGGDASWVGPASVPSASFPIDSAAPPVEPLPVQRGPHEAVSVDAPQVEEARHEAERNAPLPAASQARPKGDSRGKPTPRATSRPHQTKLPAFWCGPAGGILLGYGPAPSARVRLGCAYAPLSYFNAELSGEARLPSSQSAPPFSVQGFGGRLLGCVQAPGRLSLGPCLGFGVVQTQGDAELTSGGHARSGRVAVEVSGFLRAKYVARPFVFQFDAGASFPSEQLRHLEELPGGGETLLHQSWMVLPSMDFGIGYVFQ